MLRDLRQFITNLNDLLPNVVITTKPEDEVSAIAYLIANNFQDYTGTANNLARMLTDEIFFESTFVPQYHLEDYELGDLFIIHLVFNSILPDFDIDTNCVYVNDASDDDDEEVERVLDDYKEFFDKLIKQYNLEANAFASQIDFFARNLIGDLETFSYVIQSEYLKKIYQDEEIRKKFSSIFGDTFVTETIIVNSMTYYDMPPREFEYEDVIELIEMIKSKKIFDETYFDNDLEAKKTKLIDGSNSMFESIKMIFKNETEVIF